jgi:hypothetical protein
MPLQTEKDILPDLVRAVAEAKSVEPTELDVTIQNHMDIDALTYLATEEFTTWTLSFELPEHTVTVTSDGSIQVDGTKHTDWEIR